MNLLFRIFAVLLVIAGTIFFFQGINVLPGSFMTGRIEWAVYGGIAVAAGAGILYKLRKN